jgi:Flp pilus assembly pilin Flp
MAEHVFAHFIGDDLAQDLVEYALLLACMAFAATVGIQALGGGVAGRYAASASTVVEAGYGGARGGDNPGNPTPGAGSPGQGNPGSGNPGKGNGGGNKP